MMLSRLNAARQVRVAAQASRRFAQLLNYETEQPPKVGSMSDCKCTDVLT